jgi:signal-transduction protein with cAMP-binding, CBS, and nucleotidyltransferase domain
VGSAPQYLAINIKYFQKDQSILKEGEECDCLYVVLDGHARVVYGNNMADGILNNGDFFGDMTFQEKFVNIYSVISVDHVTLMALKYDIVEHLPDNVQLMIYKKLSKSSMHNTYHVVMSNKKMSTINAELTSYIRRMRSQTDVFINSDVFQNIINSIPKLPKCASNLSLKLLDENISAKEITESIQEDPALAAVIMKTVNSAYYGVSEKISSLHHAILHLGFNNVYNIILENSIKNIMPQDEEYENICLHSYIIFLIAGEIALHFQKSKPLVNTTIGTLHDIGKIVMLLLKRKYPHIKELMNMLDDSKV